MKIEHGRKRQPDELAGPAEAGGTREAPGASAAGRRPRQGHPLQGVSTFISREMQVPSWLSCSSWIGTVIGVAVAFPVGIKRKSLTPLAFYGTTGAMIDIIFSISDYEQQRERRLRDYVAKLNKDKEQGDADAADDGWATPADQQNQPDRAEILRD